MTTSNATPRVLISHSHEDNELVRDLARRLRAAGLKPVTDLAERPTGSDWKKNIREQIREADAVLILVTPAALASDWMLAELGMAEGFDRDIVPVTVGLRKSEVSAPLRTYHLTPFDEVDEAIRELSERLAAAVNP